MAGARRFSLGGRIFVLVLGVPFAAVGVLMGYLMLSMLNDSQRMSGWPTVDAQLTKVDLDSSRSSKGSTTYQLLATYSYQFNGRTFSGDRVGLSSGKDNIGSFQKDKYSELKEYYNRGKPFQAHVNPDNASESILFPEMRWGLFGFYAIFFVVFGMVGFGMLLGGIIGWNAAKQEAALRQRHPKEPWLHRLDWQQRKIVSGSKLVFITCTLAAIFWNAVSMPVLFVLPEELEKGEYMILLFLLFPLIGLVLIYLAGMFFLRWRRFGNAVFALETLPAWTGEKLRGQLMSGAAIPENVNINLTLKCRESRTTNSGGKSRTTTTDIWSTEKEIPLRAIPASSRQNVIPVEFEIPADARPTTVDDSRTQIFWKLEAKAKLKGADFAADFDVPVFSRS